MSMVFPDDNLDETTGGFETVDDFKEVISEINKGNTVVTLTSRASQYVYANCEDNFAKAFPLQFPYGIGGPNEMRQNGDDEMKRVDFVKYIQHVNNLSNLNFHTQLFCVFSWNILEKKHMLDRACLRVKSDSTLQKKISEAKTEDVAEYIDCIRKGRIPSTANTPEHVLLDTVNSITYALPHSNEDAQNNRKKAFSMQLRFGFPFIFFTLTPDDSSSYSVCIYTGLVFNPGDKFEDMTNDDFIQRAASRHKFRIKYPGIGALWYHAVMNAVWKHIIGWDWVKRTGSPGLYGIPEAGMQGTEEQARKRLHSHCLVWIKGATPFVEDLQSTNEDKVITAKGKLVEIVDRSTSTEFLNKQKLPNRIFQHDKPCTSIRQQSRKKPDVVPPQQLRDMRHKIGKLEHKGVIARCNKCKRDYSVEELVVTCLRYWNSMIDSHNFEVDCWSSKGNTSDDDDNTFSITGKKKLEELLFLLSIPRSTRYPQLSKMITDVVRNLHGETHAMQCFKKGDECRYHLPTLPVLKTIIEVTEQFHEWFDYLGNKTVYQIYDVNLKRSDYDVFQNQSCTAISLSKLGSNSNSQLCISGQKAMYITKYPTKSTQKEDQSEYKNVLHFTSSRLGERRFDTDCSEALSRVIGASIAHSSSNVISAWLAKYLINERSRFRFSHDFRNVPHFSIQEEIVQHHSQWRHVKYCRGNVYIDSAALQYLHRPPLLENKSLVDFEINYHVARINKDNQDRMIYYNNDGSYDAAQYQGILRSKNKTEYIPDINVWSFPDAANFEGKLLDEDSPISSEMEQYALEVLICFCPFRTLGDLMSNYSHVQKFREWYFELKKTPEQFSYIHRVLTNIQSLKNSLRIKGKDDLLCEETQLFIDPDESRTKKKKQKMDDYDKEKAFYTKEVKKYIQSMLMHEKTRSVTTSFVDSSQFLLRQLQKKGTWKCGYQNIASMDEQAKSFEILSSENFSSTSSTNGITKEGLKVLQRLRKCNLVEVMLERTIRQHSTYDSDEDSDSESEEIVVDTVIPGLWLHKDDEINANGTPESIYLWAFQSFENDKEQRRAFEILAASFVLCYCSEADKFDDTTNTLSGTTRHHYIHCKKFLQRMVGKPSKTGQLVMFVTGPGGSGKSEVIKELLRYGEQFCSNIQQPFTKRTILVTACSGVAATLIHGQTLHSATFLNSKIKNIDEDEKAKFQNCVKLLIVDEISMLSGAEIKALSKRLNWLMGDHSGVYGGIDIAFMGDFCQLPPIGKKPIYATTVVEFTSFVNCFITLHGQYRFKHDPAFGEICGRFRNGCPTIGDFIALNNRVVSSTTELPSNARTGCKRNDEREAVNVGIWLKYLAEHGEDKGFVILADDVEIRTEGAPNAKLKNLTTFYTEVGEDDCHTHMEGRFTPMLRCYPRCPLMLTTNLDVGNNLANGTQGYCVGIVFLSGETFHYRRINEYSVKCAFASQIRYLLWEVNGKTINIEPKKYSSLRTQFPFPLNIQGITNERFTLHLKATQIPLISNNATTGHKLQGSSVDILYVPSWSYDVNWPYVVLSRVKTLEGLFLGKQLDSKKDYSVPESLTRMLNLLMIQASPDEVDYTELGIDV